MTKFAEWCLATTTAAALPKGSTGPSRAYTLLTLQEARRGHAVDVICDAIPAYFTDPTRVAGLLKKLGKPAAAKYVSGKLPTHPNIRSGDLGEVLCTAYVMENTSFTHAIMRLRWKDHRNMSMRGEDLLAFEMTGTSSRLAILKAEVKSSRNMRAAVIREARKALDKDNSLPNPHALSFVADQLMRAGNEALADALDVLGLNEKVRGSQVTHMLFCFSGTDPSRRMLESMRAYDGPIDQQYVGLHVDNHPSFVSDVFDGVDL